MEKPIYFKVKIGFGADDFISINADEVGKAVRAQVSGQVAVFEEGSVAGNNIISVTPDWSRVLGYNRGYMLSGEDYNLIGRETVTKARMMLQDAKTALTAPGQKQIKGEL